MSIDLKQINKWNGNVANVTMFIALQNAVTKNNINDLVIDWEEYNKQNFNFNHVIETEGKSTNQKSSGRCWMFAGLNVIRNKFIKQLGLKSDFELSQSYLFFYDKLERANYFLESIIKNRNKELNDRLMQHLFDDPLCDGGQWHMFTNLVKKYGVIPKQAYKESFHSSNSRKMNWILTWKLRQYANNILDNKGKNIDELRDIKSRNLEEYHKILCLFLGTPPVYFEWSHKDKDDKYKIEKDLTAKDFFKKIEMNLDDYVCLVDDPRNEYNKKMKVEYLGNILDGEAIKYYNINIEEIIKYTAKSIRENQPVWFGCDVGTWLHHSLNLMDNKILNYESLINSSMHMSKKNRMLFRNSVMTHAMVFTGYENEETESECSDNIIKWRVENSWGAKGVEDGYYSMTNSWFREYVYEVVVHKELLDKEILEKMNKSEDTIILPPWDPMGSLAKSKY